MIKDFDLVLGESPTQGLDDNSITPEAKYHIDFTQSAKKIVLSLCSKGSNNSLSVDAVKMHQYKTKDSKIKSYPLWLRNISKVFTIDKMKETGLKGSVQVFFCGI